MHLFSTHRANVGLNLRADGISLAVLGSGFRKGRVIRWLEDRTIRPGLLREGPAEPNIDQLDELAAEIRAVMRPRWNPAIALSLPDACASMAVFTFESLPEEAAARDALLRWKFEHEARCAVSDADMAFRVFPIPSSVQEIYGSGRGEPVVATVFAVAIKRAILRQYQRLCEAAGLLPVSIGVASLQVFDLYRSAMPVTGEFFFSAWTSDMMVLVALKEGVPVYLRSKRVRSLSSVHAELQSSLQSFDDHYPHREWPIQAAPSPLFLLGHSSNEQTIDVDDGAIWSPTKDPQWQVQVRRQWPSLHHAIQIPETLSYGGRCALASTLVA